MHVSTLVFLSAGLISSTTAFFRLPCDNPLIVERVDPLVSFGKVAGHVHTVSGGSGFGPSSDFAALRASKCTSCRVKEDMSAYWTPSLWFQWKDGSVTPVEQVGGHLVYYLQRSHKTDKTKVTAFPAGFQMLTGNPTLRTYDATSLTAQAIGWNCLGSPSPTRKPGLPTVNCPNGLRAEVRFPSCWDGKNLYKADQSHVEYSDGESGPCPKTHPTRLPTIFFEIMYSVDPIKNLWSKAKNPKMPFVLAQGDGTGLGLHADFQNGWDVAVLQKAMDTCTNDSGRVEDCKVLTLYDREKEGTCRKTPDVNEVVTGTLPALPGCNPVTIKKPTSVTTCSLPVPAIFAKTVAYSGKFPPPGSNVVAGTPVVVTRYQGWKYLECYSDSGSSRALSKQLTAQKSVNGCLNAAKAAGFKYAGLEYGGECWAGNSLSSSSKPIGYSKCDMPCAAKPSKQLCGGGQALTLYQFVGTTAKAKRASH